MFLNAPLVILLEKCMSFPLFNRAEIINLVINIAANNEVIIPITNVVANPLIGPVPKVYNIIPVNKVVTLASIIELYALLYPSEIANLIPLPLVNSSLILS